MSTSNSVRMNKRLMSEQIFRYREHPGEINIASLASFVYSAEDPDCPLEHLIDGRDGPGGTRWASARPNTTECILLEFDSMCWCRITPSAHKGRPFNTRICNCI